MISLFAIPNPLHAQESLKINGFIQNYNAFQTTQENELLAGRNRLRFTLSRALPVGSATFESDIIHRYNDGDNDVEIRLREAYLEWFFDKSDLRIGLQNIIWGKTDAGFVTDILSPVDLREFLAVDINDIRLGVVSANFTRYFGSNFLQVIAAPAIQPDLIPQPDSRWFPVPSIASPIPVNFTTGIDRNTVDDVQGAVRYAMRSNIRFDLDFMAMYWTHPTPSYGLFLNIIDLQQGPNINLRETYNPSPMAGYSFEWRVDGSWIIKSEALYVQEKLFNYLPVSADLLEGALSNPLQAIQVLQQFEPRDDGFLIERPWLQTMLGVQTEISGFTISGQGYLETIFNFEDRILQRRIFPFTTGLIQKSFFRERLNLLSLTRYNIYADDFWVQFQGNYDVADGIEFALGTNLFGGPSPPPIFGHFTFNQFRQNSFVFARVTTYW
ncbi:MAG: hypothetical protein ACFCU6_01945 [Balneolaceae bacterium]